MATKKQRSRLPSVPVAPVEKWLVPVKSFLEIEAASGGLLVCCALFALAMANSPWAEAYAQIWKAPVSITLGSFSLSGDLGHLIINDALMTIFFFVVGLEIKREIAGGELRDPRKALLPVVGAIGGVLTPALIYLGLQSGELGQRGWAIPMATDIAFVVGILAIFGSRVPFGLKVFLLTLAIVDDLIAVLVIATFFTENISAAYLALALGGFGVTVLLNRLGVRSVAIYFAVGIVIWVAFHFAGVHPTVAGVVLGVLTPAKAWIGKRTFVEILSDYWDRVHEGDSEEGAERIPIGVEQLQFAARETISPLHRLEMALHPWVAFFVMPVFALANAGVPLELSAITHPVSLSVAAGLAIGKPLGILLFCFAAVQIGWTRLPEGVRWPMFIAAAFLGGIGFTMSLFLNSLAFPASTYPELEGAGKVGTLVASFLSTIIGCSLMAYSLRAAARRSQG